MTNIALAISCLKDNQSINITPQGSSMCPFFYGGRDSVFLTKPFFPLEKGTIALFLRSDGTYVIHRIYRVLEETNKNDGSKERQYYFLGDNQTFIEGPISESQIHAVANQICRKGKIIDCKKNVIYRVTSWIWLKIRPIRPIFIKLWNWWLKHRK